MTTTARPLPGVWAELASCAGTNPAVFFPGDGYDERRAKALCVECPVRSRCLDYALTVRETIGVWGGLNPAERRRIVRARRSRRGAV